MSNDKKVFDLEHFGLFLAAGLMGGRERLEQRWDTSLSSSPLPSSGGVSVPVYWRSSLFHDDIDMTSFFQEVHPPQTEAAGTPESTDKPMMDLLFLDATILFQTQLGNGNDDADSSTTSQNSTLSLSFGAFLRRQNPQTEYFYVQGPTVTTDFLVDHFNQHGSLVADTAAIHVANPLIRALKRLSPGVMSTVEFANDERRLSQVRVPLFYDNEDHPSYLTISNRNGPVDPLDSTVASTWLCSILSQNQSIQSLIGTTTGSEDTEEGQSAAVEKETTISKSDSKKLLASYQGWKEKAGSLLLEQRKAAAAARQQSRSHANENQESSGITGNDTTAKSNSSPSPSKAKSSKKDTKKKKPQVYGAQRVGPKKKKKKTGPGPFAPVPKTK